jgi:hypothetical protein
MNYEHKFNDDLLANEGDIRGVNAIYPGLNRILYHAELVNYFKKYNVRANNAKQRSRKCGKWAILLSSTAIFFAAVEIVAELLDKHWSLIIGCFAAMCGLIGVAVGARGVLYGPRKREWLHNRFMGERIRQFHFQSLIALFPQIAASLLNDGDEAERARVEFEAKRKRLFLQFQNEFDQKLDRKYTSVLDPDSHEHWWLLELPRRWAISDREPALDSFFAAYRQLRINHQLSYANYNLGTDHKLISAMPMRQAAILEGINKLGIGVILLIHLIALTIAVCAFLNLTFMVHPIKLISVVFSLAIVLIAVVALATRAFQQGLQPEREIERYQQYRSALQSTLENFDNADTPNQKLRVMREMERLSFEEMRNFLVTQERSSFAL